MTVCWNERRGLGEGGGGHTMGGGGPATRRRGTIYIYIYATGPRPHAKAAHRLLQCTSASWADPRALENLHESSRIIRILTNLRNSMKAPILTRSRA